MIKPAKQEHKLGGATYPKRPQFWAMKLIRLLTKCCAAQDITPTGYTLLAVIATTEDAAGYRRAVTYYDGQLAPILGTSQKSLALVRKRCVEAGWLHYEPGGKGRAARYWTTIPTHASDIDDHASDEGDDDPPPMRRKSDDESATNRESIGDDATMRRKSDDESGTNRESIGDDATWQRANILPLPIPDPIPIPKKEPPNPQGGDDAGITQAHVVINEWNATPGVVVCQSVTTKRIKALAARMRDPAWGWREALTKFPLRCFENDGGWKPDIDWFLRPDSVLNILEGKYDWRKHSVDDPRGNMAAARQYQELYGGTEQ